MKFATRAVHAGLTPDPSFGSVIPAIHQTSTYAQPAPGEFVEDYDYSRSANPTRAALETALGELEGGLGVAFSSGLAAEHALITMVCEAGAHVVLPADLYGGTFRLVDKVLKRWGLELRPRRPDRPRRGRARGAPGDEADLGRDADEPAAERRSTSRAWSRARAARSSPSTTRSPRRSTSARWSSARTSSCTRPPSTSAATPTSSAAPRSRAPPSITSACASCRTRSARSPGRFDCFLVHRGLRTLHLRMAAHAESARAVVAMLQARDDVRDVRWPGFSGMVSFRHPDATGIVAAHRAVHARRVARRRRVADRGPAGDDAPVGRGLGRGRAAGPRAALVRDRGPAGPRAGPGARARLKAPATRH